MNTILIEVKCVTNAFANGKCVCSTKNFNATEVSENAHEEPIWSDDNYDNDDYNFVTVTEHTGKDNYSLYMIKDIKVKNTNHVIEDQFNIDFLRKKVAFVKDAVTCYVRITLITVFQLFNFI